MWNDIHTHSATVMENPIVHSLVEGRLMMDEAGEEVLALQATRGRADAREMDRTVRPEAMASNIQTFGYWLLSKPFLYPNLSRFDL
jgi:hypothetical protein